MKNIANIRGYMLATAALLAVITTDTAWAKQAGANPPLRERPVQADIPTDCTGQEGRSWCRSGQNSAEIAAALSAQKAQPAGGGIRFAGLRGQHVQHSSLRDTGERIKRSSLRNTGKRK